MATYSVVEAWDSGINSTVDDEGNVERSATRKLTIVLDTGTADDAVTVKANATGIPREGIDFHPNDAFLQVTSVSVSQVSPIYYEATVEYKSPKFSVDEDQADTPATELAADIQFETVVSEGPLEEDVDGNAILTTAGERLPGLTQPYADLAVVITKNLKSFNPTSIYTYARTVNSDTFLGFPPGTALIETIRAKNAIRDNVPYWVVTVRIVFRKPIQTTNEKAWYKRVLNQGFYAYAAATDPGNNIKSRRIVDSEGVGYDSPKPIAEDGTEAGETDPAHWLEFQVFETRNFASLGLL